MKNQKPSEVIEDFIEYLEKCKSEYESCVTDVDKRTKRNIDYLHDMEFEGDVKNRSKIATKIHRNQINRRISKDRMYELEKVSKYICDNKNKPFISALKRLVQEQKANEEYVNGERKYNRRVGDET